MTPSSGQTGTEVTITGNNLIGLGELGITLSTVTLGGIEANIISSSQSVIVIRAGNGIAGSGVIELKSNQFANGAVLEGPYNSVSGMWTYLENGVITLFIPPAAQAGTTIYVCGSNILGGGNAVTNVTIIGAVSPMFSNGLVPVSDPEVTEQCITAVVPSPSESLPQEGPVNITANTKALVFTQSNLNFKYASISSVTPTEGQEYTIVTITGTHLLSGYDTLIPRVFLAGVEATIISFTTDEIVVQASPPNIASNVINQIENVEIQVNKYALNFTLTYNDGWTYLTPGEIVSVNPTFGQYGTYVTLSGTQLLGYGSMLQYVSILGSETGNFDADVHVNASIISSSVTTVTIEVPKPVNVNYTGFVDILLVADNGAQVRGNSVFEYKERGMIGMVNPTEGQRGTFGKKLCMHFVKRLYLNVLSLIYT